MCGIFPLFKQVDAIAQQHPACTFVDLLTKFEEIGLLDSHYFLCNLSALKVPSATRAHRPARV